MAVTLRREDAALTLSNERVRVRLELTPLALSVATADGSVGIAGARAAAALHLGRTVCRRAERAVIGLAEQEAVAAVLIRYLNRLSDLLFVMARAVNRRAGVAEPQWIGRER